MGRRLIEAPGLVRTPERWVVDTSGREKAIMLVGRLVASGLLKVSSLVRAARLHLRRGSSQLDGLVLLLLLLLRKGSSRLDGWELLLLLVAHVVVPAA